VSMYYETHGDGPQKILFVMGLSASLRVWEIQVQYFSKASDFQLCVFDNRGIGRSSSPTGRYTTSEMAKDALELVDHLGWKSFHIAGISMGGMISQELALLAPKRVQSLSLIYSFWWIICYSSLEGSSNNKKSSKNYRFE